MPSTAAAPLLPFSRTQFVRRRRELQAVNVPDDSAIFDDWLCLSHVPTLPVQLAPSDGGLGTQSSLFTGKQLCILPVLAPASQPWKEPRNPIVCSDVADNAIFLDFSYEIDQPATCRTERSSVHGQYTSNDSPEIWPSEEICAHSHARCPRIAILNPASGCRLQSHTWYLQAVSGPEGCALPPGFDAGHIICV